MSGLFLHPVLELPPTRLRSLVERADECAARVLVEAGRLARERIRRDARVRDALFELDAAPFVGPRRLLHATPEFVTQSDLLERHLGSVERLRGLAAFERRWDSVIGWSAAAGE